MKISQLQKQHILKAKNENNPNTTGALKNPLLQPRKCVAFLILFFHQFDYKQQTWKQA